MLQVHQEKRRRENGEKRETYWRRKFVDESIEIEEDDHYDLSSMFRGVSKEKVPEDLTCLWEQQMQITDTEVKRGYRWHPK